MEQEPWSHDHHPPHLDPQAHAPEPGPPLPQPLREVGDDEDLKEWLADRPIEVGMYQAQRVATESLRLTRDTLAQIAEETESFVTVYPALQGDVREMTQEVTDLLKRVPARALRNYLTCFDDPCARRLPQPHKPSQPTFFQHLRSHLPFKLR